nr:pentatricopeptide repeat-containing protein [Tanacetum cinerariifolium]
MTLSGSPFLIFDVHYNGIFNFMPLRDEVKSRRKTDRKYAGNMSVEELVSWAEEEATMTSKAKEKVGEKYVDADQLKECLAYYSLANSPSQCRNAKKFALNEDETTTEDHYAMIRSYAVEDVMTSAEHRQCARHICEGSKCEVIENGCSECFNSVLLMVKNKPLIIMLESMRVIVMERLNTMRQMLEKWTGDICPNIQKRLELNKDKHRFWHVIPARGNIFKVRNGRHNKKSCTKPTVIPPTKRPGKRGRPKKNMDESTRQVRQGGDGIDANMDSVGVKTGPNVDSVGVETGTNVDSVGVKTGTNVDLVGVKTGTNVDSVGAESSAGNETDRSTSLGDFVSRKGWSDFRLGARRETSVGTLAARRGMGDLTLGLRVRRGIRLRGVVAQGVRFGRLGRWFRLGDETQPNEQPTPGTQQS